jgi:acyl dehydratase
MLAPSYDEIRVGDALPELSLPAIDRTMLALFAGASGDYNPVHIDLDAARAAGIPDVFAQGMLGMAWLGRLLTGWAPQSRLRKFSVRFVGVAQLGDVIRCTGKIADKLESERCLRIEMQSLNQFGQIKITGQALVAFPRVKSEGT